MAVILLILGFSEVAIAALPPNFQNEPVLSGLNLPVSLTFLPDGRMLVLEKGGQILIADPQAIPAVATPYMTITDIESDGEKGLMEITLDPDFEINGHFYLYYSHAPSHRFRISRFTHLGNSGDLSSEVMIWEDNEPSDSCCHYGGGLDFGPDGKLYLTTGDKDDPSKAPDLTVAAGKVIRINSDRTIPPDNPYLNDSSVLPEIWAYGLRNPFRARWDLVAGRFFIGEVGGNVNSGPSQSWEDVHLGQAGANFGWPQCEGPEEPDRSFCNPPESQPPDFPPHLQLPPRRLGGLDHRWDRLPGESVPEQLLRRLLLR